MNYQIKVQVVANDGEGIDEMIYSDDFPTTVSLEENLGKLDRIIKEHTDKAEATADWLADNAKEDMHESDELSRRGLTDL